MQNWFDRNSQSEQTLISPGTKENFKQVVIKWCKRSVENADNQVSIDSNFPEIGNGVQVC